MITIVQQQCTRITGKEWLIGVKLATNFEFVYVTRHEHKRCVAAFTAFNSGGVSASSTYTRYIRSLLSLRPGRLENITSSRIITINIITNIKKTCHCYYCCCTRNYSTTERVPVPIPNDTSSESTRHVSNSDNSGTDTTPNCGDISTTENQPRVVLTYNVRRLRYVLPGGIRYMILRLPLHLQVASVPVRCGVRGKTFQRALVVGW